jgi:hypothetical protein
VTRRTIEHQPAAVEDDITPAAVDLLALDGFAFPSAVRVRQAADTIRARSRQARANDGLACYLEVGPGTIGFRCSGPILRSRSVEAERAAHRVPDTAVRLAGGLLLTSALTIVEPARRREISEWSAKSRRNMVRTLAELDWAPLFTAGLPGMVTLTYPGDWLTVAPSGPAVKRHLATLLKRWQRAWGERPAGAWKFELQSRGAPHLHLFVVPPRGTAKCGRAFRQWLSATWAEVVDHPDPEQRRRHVLAGTGVDFAEGMRAKDPKRLAVYFAGHSLKHADGKEYQHRVPAQWAETGGAPGRWWGYWGLTKVREVRDVDVADYVAARRTARRWSHAQRMTHVRQAPRVDVRTGVLRSRRVRRRAGYLRAGGLAGGWLCVNDGAAFAEQLARAVRQLSPPLLGGLLADAERAGDLRPRETLLA